MQNVEPDYAEDPQLPTDATTQGSNDDKAKEFQAALAAENKTRRSRPLLVAIVSLLLIALGAGAAIYVYKAFFEEKPSNITKTESTVS